MKSLKEPLKLQSGPAEEYWLIVKSAQLKLRLLLGRPHGPQAASGNITSLDVDGELCVVCIPTDDGSPEILPEALDGDDPKFAKKDAAAAAASAFFFIPRVTADNGGFGGRTGEFIFFR